MKILIIYFVNTLFQFIYFMITIRVILSFFPGPINSNITGFIYQITEPILAPFRELTSRFMPRGAGYYLDFSPLLALLFLNILRGIIVRMLYSILW
ncbi:MAG: YggT family protein [Tepidanaerobacteraceae bacterium]